MRPATMDPLRLNPLLRDVLEASPGAVLLVGAEGRILAHNRVAVDLLGYSGEQLAGMPVEQLVPEALREAHRAHRRDYDEGIRSMGRQRVLPVRCADGTVFPADIRIGPVGARHILVTLIDAFAREDANAALQERNRLLQMFVNHAPVALAMFDRQMRYVAVSQRWIADYGLHGTDLLGRSHYDVFPELPEPWRAVHRRALAGEIVAVEDDRFDRADGNTQWLRWEVRPWTNAEGGIGGIVIFTEDVTVRKRAELALESAKARLDAALGSMSDGVLIVDARGNPVEFNEAYAWFLRFAAKAECSAAMARLPDLLELILPSGNELPVAQWPAARCLRGEAEVGLELGLRRRDTGQHWIGSYTFGPIRDESGRVQGGVITCRDITEAKRSRRAIEAIESEAQEMVRFHVISQTVSAMAHELNQPLTAITAYSEAADGLLRMEPPALERLRDVLRKNAVQAQRAGQVVRGLLEFLSRRQIRTEPVNLNDLISQVVDRISHDFAFEATYRLQLQDGLPLVRVNRLQVEKVLVNLIENGIEAMAQAGSQAPSIHVDVRTAAEAGMAQVTVTDSGPGVAEDVRQRLFDPFFSTKPTGIGMGLAIARQIIESHGGKLWVETRLGAGASFHFTLPLAEDPDQRSTVR
jgi:PAS domain S-box-containing protein